MILNILKTPQIKERKYQQSFKSIYVAEGFFNEMTINDKEKLDKSFMMLTYLFPQNDIYFHKNEPNNIIYKILKANPMQILLHPDNQDIVKTIPLVKTYVKLNTMMTELHNHINNIKTPALSNIIKGLKEKDLETISSQIIGDVVEFNMKTKDKYSA